MMIKRTCTISAALLLMLAAGCSDDFYSVTDPDIVEGTGIDPARDGPLLARSAFQNFAEAYSNIAVYSGWWSYEARVGDTFPTRNEFGRRFIDDTNGTLNSEVWSPLAKAASTSEQSLAILAETPGISQAIAAFSTGYSLLLMAETFCEGTVAADPQTPGPRLTTDAMLDLAIERLSLARDQAQALSGAEATAFATAARVGIARAHLFAGRDAEAATIARQIPADFVFEIKYVDDPANRGRIGNSVWNFSVSRLSLVVPPEYRAIADGGDPRIGYVDSGVLAQDSELHMFRQDKFPGWGESIPLASGLEARYIAAEASGDINERLTLINARRAAGGQQPFSSADANAVMRELMEQRARDFWLEAKKMGDWRRNPGMVPYFLADGAEYYKPGVGEVGSQTCWPVPDAEKRNNPNFN